MLSFYYANELYYTRIQNQLRHCIYISFKSVCTQSFGSHVIIYFSCLKCVEQDRAFYKSTHGQSITRVTGIIVLYARPNK